MKELWINHKLVDFTNAARQQKITPGCAMMDEDNEDLISTTTSSVVQIIRETQEMQHPAHHEVNGPICNWMMRRGMTILS